jgi:peptidoglycan/LPS O-acetylase OafA/YrhL
MKKEPFIDFAKCFSIFTIVLYHTLQHVCLPQMLERAIAFGGTGVHLFFLLSGFGLSLSTISTSAGTFYLRRMTKVWLPYVLVLTISLVLSLQFGLYPDKWAAFLAGVFLYQMFIEVHIESFGGHFWFISAIMQFYLIYPLLRALYQRLNAPWIFLGICMAISITWWLLVFDWHKSIWRSWNSFFLQFLWEFALGMVLADFYRQKEHKKFVFKPDFWNYTWWVYLPVGLFFLLIVVFTYLKLGDVSRAFNDIPALIGYTSLCVFTYHVSRMFLPPLAWFFEWIAGFSYSLYLTHALVLTIYLKILYDAGVAASAWTMLPFWVIILLAARVFEPISQWWIKLFERREIQIV